MTRTTLKSEIKQKKPFMSLEEETFLNILRTHGIVLGPLSKILREHGLTQPQYNILRILRGAGAAGLHCLEIAGRMVTREPDITRLLDRLERSGWIARARSAEDRRVVNVKITLKGLKLLSDLDKSVNRTHKDTLGHMKDKELETLNRLLVKARLPSKER